MFFNRKVDPAERSKVLKVLGKWHRDTDAVDNATDAMRLISASNPNGIQSDDFEEKRLATVELVRRLLEETKDQRNWPLLEDDKGSGLITALQMLVNEVLAQQLDSLRLQREYVEALKLGRVTSADLDAFTSLNNRMGRILEETRKVGSRLARRYKVTSREYVMAARSSD